MIYCPVCGKNIKYDNKCSRCGYEKQTDYEAYPTIIKISNGLKSVDNKRQAYLSRQFDAYLEQHIQARIASITEQIQMLPAMESQVHMLKEKNNNLEKQIDDLRQKMKEKTEQVHLEEEKKRHSPKLGDSLYFGSYWQDNDTANKKKPIEWIVLDRQNDKLLLVSKYAVDCMPYNKSYTSTTWEQCTLRAWLNVTFLKIAFSSTEISKIVTMGKLEEKVFVLSIAETEKYFPDKQLRLCLPTAYAIKQGALRDNKNGNCWWWLRSSGIDDSDAANVNNNGEIDYDGLPVDCDMYSVRPAIWVTFNEIKNEII